MLAFFRLFFHNALPSLNGSLPAELSPCFLPPIFRKGASLAAINARSIFSDGLNRPPNAAQRRRQKGILHAYGMKIPTPLHLYAFTHLLFLTPYSSPCSPALSLWLLHHALRSPGLTLQLIP